MKKDEILLKLKQNKSELKKFGVKKIGLFGSYVKDSQNEESDIDFIVEFMEGHKTFDNFMDLKFFLEDTFEKEIDLVTRESIKPAYNKTIMESVEYV
ncbi:nucleotidyltransferase family protein [Natranaerofaba carboxydovora]|uniref:nucleotidyltransferase family protein n=1 Tax=Natranaerofaba carboxydovora TaxID=2742683 RepID=UPI001F12C11E|nr:nucleotidyltransferase family protein [Natranaerofaba carboxydovora]UMZ72537.1 Nucleotidyltransferase domain protein [Natranaerofaba carboxydovora]